MAGRALFVVVTAFWMVMNVLLWRSEYGPQTSSSVPIESVWDRILTAADSSSMQVYQHGQLLGVLKWSPTVIESSEVSAVGTESASSGLEGMIQKTGGYRIELDGTLQLGDAATQRFRVNSTLELGTNQVWREFETVVQQRRTSWQVGLRAVDQTIRLAWQEGDAKTEQTLRFADLSNPARLLEGLGVLAPLGLVPSTLLGAPGTLGWSSRLKSTAVNDTLRVGNARLRVFRIHIRFLERFDAVLFVSRAGELLKIELPDQLRIVNSAFPNL